MFQRIARFIVTIAGVLVALVVGLWALLSIAFIATGAAIVYAIRSRGWGRARKKHRRDVIEGDFRVVDDGGERHGASNREDDDPRSRLP